MVNVYGSIVVLICHVTITQVVMVTWGLVGMMMILEYPNAGVDDAKGGR